MPYSVGFPPIAWFPVEPTFARVVSPVSRSCTKTSEAPLVSFGTRFDAADWNVTVRPSPLIHMPWCWVSPFPWPPSLARLTRIVRASWRSRTKPSMRPFVSPGTRSEAEESNVTNRPSALSETSPIEAPFAAPPVADALTSSVVPAHRSRTKTSSSPLVSPGTRLGASERKATNRPFPLIAGRETNEERFEAWAPVLDTLTRVVAPVARSCTNTSSTPLVSPATRSAAVDRKTTIRPL